MVNRQLVNGRLTFGKFDWMLNAQIILSYSPLTIHHSRLAQPVKTFHQFLVLADTSYRKEQ
jgi:hypothetical protein